MKKHPKISDKQKWQAVIQCDQTYDGVFFYGVSTTGIFCKPSCKSKTPIKRNVVYFDTALEAMHQGFRPCKRCRPEQAGFAPEAELVARAKNLLDAEYNTPIDLPQLARQLGINKNYLSMLFKQHTALTPTQYRTWVRVANAQELLRQQELSILEIAYGTGFKSLSNFYKCFKTQTGFTPREYRNRKGG